MPGEARFADCMDYVQALRVSGRTAGQILAFDEFGLDPEDVMRVGQYHERGVRPVGPPAAPRHSVSAQ